MNAQLYIEFVGGFSAAVIVRPADGTEFTGIVNNTDFHQHNPLRVIANRRIYEFNGVPADWKTRRGSWLDCTINRVSGVAAGVA